MGVCRPQTTQMSRERPTPPPLTGPVQRYGVRVGSSAELASLQAFTCIPIAEPKC